jgi:CRP-like cAMP-binding protein
MAAINFKRASVQNFFKQDIINTRGAGASFGQIGLLKNQPRGATVICKTDCRVARVSKDCYIKVAKYQDQLLYKRRMDFFKNVDIFHSLKAEEISPLGYFGIDITFPKGKVILKEGAKVLSIFIVKSGDVVHRRKGLQISILGTHCIIGDVSLIKPDQQKSSFKEGDFVALSEVEVVELNLHDLFSVLRLESQEAISKSVLDKYKWHDSRFSQISNNDALKTMQASQGKKEKQLTIYDLLNTRNAAAGM